MLSELVHLNLVHGSFSRRTAGQLCKKLYAVGVAMQHLVIPPYPSVIEATGQCFLSWKFASLCSCRARPVLTTALTLLPGTHMH